MLKLIFMTFITINVYANTTNEITMNSTNTTEGGGDEIEIVVSAKSENGIEGIDGILKYDKTKLKLINEDELVTADFSSVSGLDEENAFNIFLTYFLIGSILNGAVCFSVYSLLIKKIQRTEKSISTNLLIETGTLASSTKESAKTS